MNEILRVEGVSKYYYVREGMLGRKVSKIKAVDNVSLSVKRGRTLGIAGESGSGKSTLCMCIARLLQPDNGRLILEGRDYTTLKGRELREIRSRIQIVFQNPANSLDPHMKVKDIILEPVISLKGRSEANQELVRKLLSDVGLPDYVQNMYPHELSGGMMQRVAIARALSIRPEIIILDEPTSALDASIQAQILNLFNSLQKEYGVTYILVSHDLSVIGHMCDEVAVMYAGKVVEFGSFEDVFYYPRHPYTVALLASSRVLEGQEIEESFMLKGEIPSPRNPPAGCTLNPRCPFVSSICKQVYPEKKYISDLHYVTCHNLSTVENIVKAKVSQEN